MTADTGYRRLCGRVVAGERRGRELGFPTANIQLHSPGAIPPDGIYACFVQLPAVAQHWHATASIGNNPTFGDIGESRIEVYIHGITATLYGRVIYVALIERLRDMVRFTSTAELARHTQADIGRSRRILRARGDRV